jgi:hypothetical protein
MITDQLQVPATRFEEQTGWAIKPEGACKGDICVPLPDGVVEDGVAHVVPIAERLGMPIIHDDARSLYALGPESLGGHVLATAEAPELVLPTVDGDEFRLSSLRGKKVLLVAWAPY